MSSTTPGNVVSGPGTIADRLPHDPEAERAVLGAVLASPYLFRKVDEGIRARVEEKIAADQAAFAEAQERLTVAVPTSSAAAVSATVSPPKKRHSTTRARRSKSPSRCVRAMTWSS